MRISKIWISRTFSVSDCLSKNAGKLNFWNPFCNSFNFLDFLCFNLPDIWNFGAKISLNFSKILIFLTLLALYLLLDIWSNFSYCVIFFRSKKPKLYFLLEADSSCPSDHHFIKCQGGEWNPDNNHKSTPLINWYSVLVEG